jgi:hypothetical protein
MLTTESHVDPMVLYREVNEVISRLFEIQNAGKATVFFSLSGHVEKIEVSVHAPTWISMGGTETYSDFVHLSPCNHIEVAKFKKDLFEYLDTL